MNGDQISGEEELKVNSEPQKGNGGETQLSRPRRRRISDEIRNVVIGHATSNHSNSSIARLLGLPRTTVSTIVTSYLKEGKTSALQRGGDRRTILSDIQKEQIRSWVDEDATLTLNKLKENVLMEMNLEISTSTLSRCLNNFHYTLKTKRRRMES